MKRAFRYNSLDNQQARVRAALDLPAEFVVYSLRQTMLTRLGAAGVDALTIMKIAGHSSLDVPQQYVHPSNDAI